MPPKAKFTKEEIIEAALELVKKEGIEAVTARAVAKELNSSARPIFTVFENMEQLQQEVKLSAMKYFEAYSEREIKNVPAFKQVGIHMIMFAMKEPKLYQLLFMTESKEVKKFDELFDGLGNIANLCLGTIQRDYELNLEEARTLFNHLWIYTYGIGVLCANKVCSFTEQEIEQMLGTVFFAMISLIKSGNLDKVSERSNFF